MLQLVGYAKIPIWTTGNRAATHVFAVSGTESDHYAARESKLSGKLFRAAPRPPIELFSDAKLVVIGGAIP
jgi:hypothetical protein